MGFVWGIDVVVGGRCVGGESGRAIEEPWWLATGGLRTIDEGYE